MTKNGPKAAPHQAAPSNAAREERLAAALRSNLNRRKAQARARAGASDPQPSLPLEPVEPKE